MSPTRTDKEASHAYKLTKEDFRVIQVLAKRGVYQNDIAAELAMIVSRSLIMERMCDWHFDYTSDCQDTSMHRIGIEGATVSPTRQCVCTPPARTTSLLSGHFSSAG